MYEKKVIILFNVLSFLFYCCDFFALYYSIKTINIIEKMNNKLYFRPTMVSNPVLNHA